MRRGVKALLAPMMAVGLVAGVQGPAFGALPSTIPAPMCQSKGVETSDPVATATAQRVQDILIVGSNAYFGGRFTSMLSPDGSTEKTRHRLGACSLGAGDILDWNPDADGTVYALASASGTGLIYAGGSFTHVGGAYHPRIVAIDPGTGKATGWPAKVGGGSVKTLAVSGSTLYLGGTFKTVNGQPRNRLAAVDTGTGALLDWNPGAAFDPAATYDVRALVVSGTAVIVGEASNSNAMPNMMRVDGSSGARLSWNYVPTRPILGLSLSGTRVYAAATGSGGRLYAFNASTGSRAWQLTTDGNIQGVWATTDAIYAGGHFDNVKNPDGTLTPRDRLLAVSPSNVLLGWDPGVDQSGQGPYSLRGTSSALLIGGEFRFLAGDAHQGIGKFTIS